MNIESWKWNGCNIKTWWPTKANDFVFFIQNSVFKRSKKFMSIKIDFGVNFIIVRLRRKIGHLVNTWIYNLSSFLQITRFFSRPYSGSKKQKRSNGRVKNNKSMSAISIYFNSLYKTTKQYYLVLLQFKIWK